LSERFAPSGSISLPGDSKVHFGFAVYEVSKLEHTTNSLCLILWAHQFGNQGAQNLRDVHSSLQQRFPCQANPTLTVTVHFHTLVLEPQTLQITTCLLFGVREE